MKIPENKLYDELRSRFRDLGNKIQNNKPSETEPSRPDSILTTDDQEEESNSLDKSTHRALELSRKGIFACPRYARFFNDDEDEVRIY